ncbi:MAG: hypothetical protein R3B84_21340 [Zavarzinella sp.]
MKTKMLATVLVAFSVGCLTTAVLFYRSTAPAPEPEVAVAAPPKTATMAITRQGGSKTAPARRFSADLPNPPEVAVPNRLPPLRIELPMVQPNPRQLSPTIPIVDRSYPIAPELTEYRKTWVKKFDFKEYGQVTVTIAYKENNFKANIFAEIGGGVLDVNLVGENSASQQGVVYGVITKTEIVDLQLPPHPALLEFSKFKDALKLVEPFFNDVALDLPFSHRSRYFDNTMVISDMKCLVYGLPTNLFALMGEEGLMIYAALQASRVFEGTFERYDPTKHARVPKKAVESAEQAQKLMQLLENLK